MKKFISFEGGEGSGKSTQADLLHKSIRSINKKSILTREPGGTKEIENIRRLIVKSEFKFSPLTELLLINAARNEHLEKIIKPSLKNEKIVITDRYVDSTFAYQITANEINSDYYSLLNKIIVKKIMPSITFFIDIDPNIGIKRSLLRRNNETKFEEYNLKFHMKVREGYELLAKKNKRIKKIDGEKTVREIHRIIIDYLNKKRILKKKIPYSL